MQDSEPATGLGSGPRLDPFEMTERARAACGADGRLPLPHTAHWPIFPFLTDGLQVRSLEAPVVPEPARRDEKARDCSTCKKGDDDFIWTDERWLVSMPSDPMSLPSVVLHPRDHLDFADLTEELGAEMGVLLVRIERALGSIEGIERVHINKWGDGGAHLHVFVVARPRGMMQLRGMFLTTWMHILPPLPLNVWRSIRSHVAVALAESGGRPRQLSPLLRARATMRR